MTYYLPFLILFLNTRCLCLRGSFRFLFRRSDSEYHANLRTPALGTDLQGPVAAHRFPVTAVGAPLNGKVSEFSPAMVLSRSSSQSTVNSASSISGLLHTLLIMMASLLVVFFKVMVQPFFADTSLYEGNCRGATPAAGFHFFTFFIEKESQAGTRLEMHFQRQ